ncbi:hypothetical protein C3747_261g35 [Trypanosoma cruzi]|uniref:Ubiquitin-like domain-containing protein n=2 Tax=Trypanosoma cruzi TaxID=5693 RepID=Q4E2I9_TRYCC|nr:hypothetical protein, conserved [Trypanosoma cruzi]7AOR_av Chain av, mS68 [Trypanosoma cruzi strain CL Brener]EAN99017.1 hypothetical protein, conserved [Trypanosoma cruzi]KAF5224558.1 hypothetical protein ECC02_002196 [Trypanosoma cruzi]KAF8292107.1 putative Mitochondrial SSU ribosomal protein [Trypanosoma cruzi]PWU96053.1 hypothetical protein C3747_261g35 [Trypanosoma cruzi]|eukprot:XP_820868.1 hypothetical protein [Trypanosoma cruzi strain CL Brener]
MFRISPSLAWRRTAAFYLRAGKLGQYEREAFEARRRLEESKNYPGPIRSATPGDTRFYAGSLESILQDNDRHYWRAVIDDPQVQYVIPLRIRFKLFTWVTTGWEQRLHIVQTMAPRDITIARLIELVTIENQSPYLCSSTFTLAVDGKELDPDKSLSDYGITEHSRIDAIEKLDHLLHKDSERPLDWTVDEMTTECLKRSPYKEMGMQPQPNLAPRYEARPKGYFGRNNYSGMKQES